MHLYFSCFSLYDILLLLDILLSRKQYENTRISLINIYTVFTLKMSILFIGYYILYTHIIIHIYTVYSIGIYFYLPLGIFIVLNV